MHQWKKEKKKKKGNKKTWIEKLIFFFNSEKSYVWHSKNEVSE